MIKLNYLFFYNLPSPLFKKEGYRTPVRNLLAQKVTQLSSSLWVLLQHFFPGSFISNLQIFFRLLSRKVYLMPAFLGDLLAILGDEFCEMVKGLPLYLLHRNHQDILQILRQLIP